MIDTYVYFVSYKYYEDKDNGNGDATVEMDRKITTDEDLEFLKEMIRDDNQTIILLNFQLLDSYNKEERGKDD